MNTVCPPSKWKDPPIARGMQGMHDIVLRGQGLPAVLTEAAVPVGLAVVFFGIGVARFRYE
jgi:hypothetical protein